MKLWSSVVFGVGAAMVPSGRCSVLQAPEPTEPCMLVASAQAFAGDEATDCGHVFGDRPIPAAEVWDCAEEHLDAGEGFLVTHRRQAGGCISGLDRPPQVPERPTDVALVGLEGRLYAASPADEGIVAVDVTEVDIRTVLRAGRPFSFTPSRVVEICTPETGHTRRWLKGP
ncbi:MAG: hypothetical protein KTR31_03920 [Myxococcales bacterium]|nr:hypothetical protein [Myxococcales bacterium]